MKKIMMLVVVTLMGLGASAWAGEACCAAKKAEKAPLCACCKCEKCTCENCACCTCDTCSCPKRS